MSKGNPLHTADRGTGEPRPDHAGPRAPTTNPIAASTPPESPIPGLSSGPGGLRAALLGAFLAATLAACSSTAPRTRLPADASSPHQVQTNADWDDLEPAVALALGRTELVRLRIDRPEPGRVEFVLRSSRDEPARLTAERLAPPDTPDPVDIRLTCTVGRFGDPARERQFLDLIVRRLTQLRGVETAPARF
jgi:hypothetical protein